MSSSNEIDLVSRDVMERTKEITELGKVWTSSRSELSELCEALVSETSSVEVKQKFQVVAMDVAEKGSAIGAKRKELREVTTRLLELVKADGRENLKTVDGVELTMSPTLQFKIPSPEEEKKKEEGVEEEKKKEEGVEEEKKKEEGVEEEKKKE
jgi:hypothetical protein